MLFIVILSCLFPPVAMHAGPPPATNIVISQRYRFVNYGLTSPARVSVEGPGYFRTFNSKDGLRVPVDRIGRYVITGEYRSPEGRMLKVSTSITLKKLGGQQAVTLLYVP